MHTLEWTRKMTRSCFFLAFFCPGLLKNRKNGLWVCGVYQATPKWVQHFSKATWSRLMSSYRRQ